MGAGELLRRLDRQVLPPLGHALVWCLEGAIRRRVVIASGVLASTALLAASVWAAHEPPTRPRHAGHVVRVGVSEGQSVDSYESQAGEELAKLGTGNGRAYALVSLNAYLAPDRFARILRGTAVYRAYVRVPLPDSETSVAEITIRVMPGDLSAGMADVGERKAAEGESYRRDADKLTGSSQVERERRDRYRALADAAAAEAAALRAGCSCLFAAVVRASTRALTQLADTPGVRTVDVAPEVTALKHAVFVPPLPESAEKPQPEPSEQASMTPSESHSGSPGSASPSGSESPSPDDSASLGSPPPPDRGGG